MTAVARGVLVAALCGVLVVGSVALAREDSGTAGRPGDDLALATTAPAVIPSALARTAPTKKVWKPRKGATWQWQLSGRIDTSVKAQIYDIDSSVSPKVVKTLHAKRRKVICYLSAGSWEKGRPDASRFPASVRGRTLEGWPDERWLDIRKVGILKPLMAARMDVCRAKGFDGVEADNVDGYQNASGFALTAKAQRRYNVMLANLAHARGLAIGLKNDLDQVRTLEPHFEFAINEQCAEYAECDAYRPFLRAGKPVLHAEYTQTRSAFCPTSRRLKLSSIRKKMSLSAWRRTC